MKKTLIIVLCVILLVFAGCSTAKDGAPVPGISAGPSQDPDGSGMTVTSSGIADGYIDPKYGMHGEQKDGVPILSLPLSIGNAPAGTKSFAIYMDDPDAGNFVHWLAANIKEKEIPEGFSQNAGGKAVKGKNDFGATGYGGPKPPNRDHTYVIRVYALNSMLDLKEGFTAKEFNAAVKGHELGYAVLKGIYKK